MDANWRPTQGSDPAAGVDPNAPLPTGSGDWRAQLLPEARSRILNKIMETLTKHLPAFLPHEIENIAVQLEDKTYTAASNQSDYVRRISLKLLSLEMPRQLVPGNAQVIPNQNYSASADFTAQIDHADADDWQEEIYQMIKSLKNKYFAEISELFNQLSVKLQDLDSIIPPQEPSELYDRMKTFKIMLDRILQMLQISKSSIQPDMRDKVPRYEKQIISILNVQRMKPVQPQIQQQFQPPAASADPTAQTGHAVTGDWQEEIYQMLYGCLW